MRAAPLNYLLTTALGGLVFFTATVLIGNYLGNTVSLLGFTITGFLQLYRLLVAIAVVLGLCLSFIWYSYGSRPATAGRLGQAKHLWTVLFICGLAEAGALLGALMFMLRAEAFTLGQYIILFVVVSLSTYLLFWMSTLLMSPAPVKRIPWGMSL